MMAQRADEGNAFTFDDEEDMDYLLEQAANAGSAATDEQHGPGDYTDELFGVSPDTGPTPVITPEPVSRPEPVQEPVYAPEPIPVEEPEPTFDIDEVFSSQPEPTPTVPTATVDDVERELAALNEESRRILEEPEPVREPVATAPTPVERPAPVVPTTVEGSGEYRNTPRETTREPVSSRMTVIRQTEEEQIAHARAVIAASDEFRKLSTQTKEIAAQLISQESDFTTDEATIAIRAINADELTFVTMASLKEAKALEPLERAFYILQLTDEVRNSLGTLVSAFSGEEFSTKDTLSFSRALVIAIEKLDKDAIGFVTATEAVLRAAKQR